MPNVSTLPEMQKKGVIFRDKCLATQALKWKVELLIYRVPTVRESQGRNDSFGLCQGISGHFLLCQEIKENVGKNFIHYRFFLFYLKF